LNGLTVHSMDLRIKEMKVKIPGFADLEAQYLQRIIFVSQHQPKAGGDVFVFGMYIYKFGEDSSIPRNNGLVYLAYLASTDFYKSYGHPYSPHQTIVNAYFDYTSAINWI